MYKVNPPPVTAQKKQPVSKRVTASKPVAKVTTPPKKKVQPASEVQQKPVVISIQLNLKSIPANNYPPPLVLKVRENALVKKIETEAGVIRINCYDNGDIDGDTVSIYHNNKLIKSHMRAF